MDIPTTAASASAYTQAQTADQIGTAVAAKVLDAVRQTGAASLQLLTAAAGVGRASTADTNGVGRHVDVVA